MGARKWLGVVAIVILVQQAHAEESAWTLLDQGIKEYRKGNLTRAEKIFDAAIRRDKRCEDAHYYLGVIAEKRGMSRRAEEFFGKVTEKAPTYSLAAERLGHIALRKGDKEKALTHFLVYAKDRPSGRSHMQVGTVQLDLKKYKEAELSLVEAKKFLRNDLDLVEMFARLYMETKRFGDALDAYTQIVKTIPNDTTARFLRGVCLERLTRNDDAVAEYRLVLERDPYHGPSLKALIRHYDSVPSRRSEVAEYRKRLEALAKHPPKVRSVSGSKKKD